MRPNESLESSVKETPDAVSISAEFVRLGIVLEPDRRKIDRAGILNPASARLRDGALQLYPRMVEPGNISRIGTFQVHERGDRSLRLTEAEVALSPEAPYELRDGRDGYGCEDPRVTFIRAIDCYVMSYVAFGPRGPEVALAVSPTGLKWRRLGLMCFQKSRAPFADKDAAFFPEPVLSPSGVESLAFYHRPTLWTLWRKGREHAAKVLKRSSHREHIAIGYVPLARAQADLRKLCEVTETHPLHLSAASWGKVKVGGGTPPVRIPEGWLSVIHGVDECHKHTAAFHLQYCAGIIIHDARRLDQVVYRSPEPLFVPEIPAEVRGKVGHVVFPTAIDPRPDRGSGVYDIYYGMGDRRTGRGRLTLRR